MPSNSVASHTRCVDWNSMISFIFNICFSRISYEVRGLKYELRYRKRCPDWSHLIRGAWIEIGTLELLLRSVFCRISYEVRGLKSWADGIICTYALSHLIRGAWIEILNCVPERLESLVASHTRCVDWNSVILHSFPILAASHLIRGAWIEIMCAGVLFTRSRHVASHTRCVDWNFY